MTQPKDGPYFPITAVNALFDKARAGEQIAPESLPPETQEALCQVVQFYIFGRTMIEAGKEETNESGQTD
ncbi:MAG: hypothetical protein A2Y57_02340 [Candidatus Woykebacteria bacterium RBG_13_40_7b]|uniref:Uncharacterized protein n=1 Tax=Candidatus Woykebacteria bacterium RBG_13_40_7b TaxID=1802594 RepID=A0A1G1WB76_9BACT|nr:MAG: hypothetical protein A2Y57_02340 [Candidatus Woykebacteria bacterium RBG_13_40_7b]